MPEILPRDFYARPALQVARELLGMRLVRSTPGLRLSGIILETEAYSGEDDLGCHCKAGRTPRTQVMYGPPGRAYVYFTYGMHWMLNFVAAPPDFPAAVLIRALLAVEGAEVIAARRSPHPPRRWMDGPGKLCQALAIDGRLNGIDVCDPASELFVEVAAPIPDQRVTIGPRVGLYSVPEPWKSIPWRFLARPESAIASPFPGSAAESAIVSPFPGGRAEDAGATGDSSGAAESAIASPLPGGAAESAIASPFPGSAAESAIVSPLPGGAAESAIASPLPGGAAESAIASPFPGSAEDAGATGDSMMT